MKKIFLVVLVTSLSIVSLAQRELTDNIIWGKLEKTEKKKDFVLIGNTDKELIYLSSIQSFMGSEKMIQTYDKMTLKLTKSSLLTLEFKENKLNYLDLCMVGEKPIVFSSFYNGKARIMYLFYQVVNLNDLTLSEPELLKEYDYNKIKVSKETGTARVMLMSKEGAYYATYPEKVVKLISSDDEKTSFVTFANLPEYSSNMYDFSYTGKVFDTNFKEINSFEYSLPFKNYKIRDIKVSNDGMAYILVDKLTFTETPKNQIISNFQLSNTCLLYIDLMSGEYDVIELELNEKVFMDVIMKLTNNRGVIISGLINNVGDKGTNELFSAEFDSEMTEVNSVNLIIEEDFITANWSDQDKFKFDKLNKKNHKKGLNKETPQLKNYLIKDIIELNDGSFTVLAEKYINSNGGNNPVHVTIGSARSGAITYYYGDIIAINYNSSEKYQWVKRIEKQQTSSNDHGEYSSIFVIPTDEVIEIIYNEDEAPIKVQLRPDGTVKKESFIKFDEKRTVLLPKQCRELNNDEFLLYTIGKSGNKIGILKL